VKRPTRAAVLRQGSRGDRKREKGLEKNTPLTHTPDRTSIRAGTKGCGCGRARPENHGYDVVAIVLIDRPDLPIAARAVG
jgi:hypothetical protein